MDGTLQVLRWKRILLMELKSLRDQTIDSIAVIMKMKKTKKANALTNLVSGSKKKTELIRSDCSVVMYGIFRSKYIELRIDYEIVQFQGLIKTGGVYKDI